MTAKEIAMKIKRTATNLGFTVTADSSVMTITKAFTPGDMDAFVECDITYNDVLSLLPQTSPGSDWGTDGSGVGGYSAHKNGFFKMNRSGGSKRVLNALRKVLAG